MPSFFQASIEMVTELYIVIEGGCVRYVSSTDEKLAVVVVDLDDYFDDPQPQTKEALERADALVKVW